MSSTIVAKLVEAGKKIGAVGKGGEGGHNDQQNFDFRGIDRVVNACSPVFGELGILVYPVVQDSKSELITYGRNNTVGFRTQVTVDYVFTDGDSSVACRVCAESIDSGDKGAAKAMSVAYRIALLQTLTLPTSERDPDADSYEVTNTADGARTQAVDAAWAAVQATDLKAAGKKALIEQAIGHELGDFAELFLEEAQAVLWAAEDPTTVARYRENVSES